MNLAQDIYPLIGRIKWLTQIDSKLQVAFDFAAEFVESREVALQAFSSELWADVKTEAQGDLTGYLSKHHYNAYGGHWNKLAKESRALVKQAASDQITRALAENQLPSSSLQPILVDVNRAALEIAYRRKFLRVPIFFEQLLQIYEAGRLPCGWSGDLSRWPTGRIIVF